MTGDGKIIARAQEALNQRKIQRETMFRLRREEVFSKNANAKELDRRIRALPAQAFRLSLEDGEEAAEKISLLKQESFQLRGELAQELVLMGLPHDWLDEDYYCPKCRDTGYVNGKMCDCLKELVAKEQTRELSNLLDMGGETFHSFRLSLYDDTPLSGSGISPRAVMKVVYDVCRNFALNFGEIPENLFLSGGTGLGKTFLSTAIAKEVAAKGFSVVYASAQNCFTWFENEKFLRDDDASRQEVERMLNCDLLLMDDLGTEMTTSFTVSALYRIVNSRLTGRRSTVISTNLKPEELASRYSPAISSRILGEYKVLSFAGRDIRTLGRRG